MKLEDAIQTVVNECRALLSPPVWEHINELVTAGECSLAIEELCSYLVEASARPSKELVERIARVGESLDVKPSYWSTLLNP